MNLAEPAAASNDCVVSTTEEAPDWGAYLAGREATVFHDPRWAQIMRDVYGNRCFYLTARRGDEMVGVLQLVAKKSLLFGRHLCSLPYFDAAGVLADDAVAAGALVAGARSLREEFDAGWVELRQEEVLDASLPLRTDKITLRLALPAGPDDLWKRLESKIRNHVRKAEKAGLTVRQGGAELLDEFFAIYVRTMRDLGSPPHSRRFFGKILEGFGSSVRLFVVHLGERPVAASLVLADPHGVHVPWSGSDRRVRDLCGNVFLYWSMLSDACGKGAKRFDFGRSTRDSGTHTFKKQWGATEVPLYWHYLLPANQAVPELRHDSRKYRFVEACWRKLPLSVARVLGPPIIGKLS